MPKRKISSGPQQLDCSDGAKMLIDQMKDHPEEFRGYASKYRDTLEAAQRTLHQPSAASAAYQMSTRDARAIMEAAETHLFEVWLAEDVLTKMMAPKPELNEDAHRAYAVGMGRGTGKSVLQGQIAASPIYGNGTIGAGTPQYVEQAYQMELAKYKMEQERRENEHAMRNTIPNWNNPR